MDGHSLLVRETDRLKRGLVVRMLKKHGGVKARAARELQIDASHLRRLIKKWGLKCLLVVVLFAGCDQPPPPHPQQSPRDYKVATGVVTSSFVEMQRDADLRRALMDLDIARRRLNHVCPEAFPLPGVATQPLTNTTPTKLVPADLQRYNRCAEASGIAH